MATTGDEPDRDDDPDDITGQVEQPAKVMRIGTMIKQLLEEVRQAPLDEAGRRRLREIHESSIKELSSGLSAELRDELDRLSLPFGGDTPSEAELRVAQAQLVGWLEGLFHGIQTAIYAQQATARAQLEQMAGRRQLPGGAGGRQIVVGPDGQLVAPSAAGEESARGTGQYL
ncbi:bacterial proteasome activator family protein [Jatrophihabitans endophyticus]|uniref:bacterial proteasome activator family protein n=1 Tax=Jatrophihabitans endophyticus TaxID=1206085 RepID=UPI0009348B48